MSRIPPAYAIIVAGRLNLDRPSISPEDHDDPMNEEVKRDMPPDEITANDMRTTNCIE